MAQHLARIHGTEEDKVNCPFYFKIGACRHSDRCSRLHHKPTFSPTLLVKHLYQHPVRQAELHQAAPMSPEQATEDFLCFFEDMYTEFSKFGRLDELHVVDNLGDHMIGHVYVKFENEEQASDALQVMHGRYYDGRPMHVEFSPVTDFREARCRDYDEDVCSRGGFCNFLHSKPAPGCLIRSLEEECEVDRRRDERKEQSRRSSHSKKRKKEASRSSGSKRHSKRSRREDNDSGGASSSEEERSYHSRSPEP
jgi:splicing factor U2AF subunit